jgi:hypothetical protein
LVAVRPAWLERDRLARTLAWAALAFPVSIVLAHALFVRMTPHVVEAGLLSLAIAAVLSLPFLAAGTVVTLALAEGSRPGRAYAANLIGSGAGCFIPLALLGPLDAEHLLALLALLAWLSAVLYVARVDAPKTALRVALAAALVLCALAYVFAREFFPIKPDASPSGQLAGQYRYAAQNGIGVEKVFDRWNPTGRIEVIRFRHVPKAPDPYYAMFYAQDSSAGSSLFAWDGKSKSEVQPSKDDPGSLVSRMCTETLYGQGYFAPRPHVLVIGLGGGPDVQCALYQEAKQIDVVEINRDSIAGIRGPLNAWTGGIGRDPRVRFHERDGRSFVHDQRDRFDLIQLSGVDTKNALASGSFALSENHLYTVEAMRDYLRSLSPDGVVSIIRFGEAEGLRLAYSAIVALRAIGVAEPERHVAVLHTGIGYGVMIRRSPWNEADAAKLQQRLRPPYFRGFSVYYYSDNGLPFETPANVDYLPPRRLPNVFGMLLDSTVIGKLAERAALYPMDISPTTDDRPFFFDVWRYDQAATWRMFHVVTLRNLLASVVALSLLLILLPVRKLRNRAGAGRASSRPAFFACVGFGFILLEVWLLHRFTMYLGHQVYSLSVVLSTLLLATGVGAALGDKLLPDPRRRALVSTALVPLWALATALLLPPVLEATWSAGLPLRAAVAMLFTGLTGLLLGQPFVGGLTWLRSQGPENVAWCIGINGFCSVIGSVVVIPLLMAFGYVGSLSAGAALYALAALAAFSMGRGEGQKSAA